MLPRLSQLLLAALALSGVVSADPSGDEEVRAFFAREGAAVKPLNLGRRSAATTPARHLRPMYEEDEAMMRKRDIMPPDVGQVADFGGQNPEPIRNGAGDTFLATSNHEIDAQNPDNVAAPTTDAGTSAAVLPRTRAVALTYRAVCRRCAEFEVEHVLVPHTTA